MINDRYTKSFNDSYEESSQSQEEAFCQIFNPILEPMDINDEINHDKLYFVNNKTSNNNNINNNNNNIIYFEDFDEFYKKFVEINEESNLNLNETNIFDKTLFHTNLSHEEIFTSFEDEKFFLVKNSEENNDKNILKNENINISIFNKPESKNLKNKNFDENYFFPFTPGKGLLNSCNIKISDDSYINSDTTEKINLEENSSSNNNNEQINYNYDFKFKTKRYFIMPNGKKRLQKKKRKYKSDDIRKKIKSRFHKTIKNIINDFLKKGGSKKFFDFLPQNFIGNVSKKVNSESFELTFKELHSYQFEGKNDNPVDNKKIMKNKEVVEYLEKNPEICKNSGYDLIKNKKYKELLKIYFSSAEFENSITRLKEEKEDNDYIQEYIFRAKNYIEFYSNYDKEKNSEDNDKE